MRKRVGKILVNPQEECNKNIYKDIPIWGTLWWDPDREYFMSGVYMNFSPRQFVALSRVVSKIMEKTDILTIKYKTDMYGSRYQVGMFCKQGSFELDIILNRLKGIQITDDDIISYNAKIEMGKIKFDDIIKEGVVKKL